MTEARLTLEAHQAREEALKANVKLTGLIGTGQQQKRPASSPTLPVIDLSQSFSNSLDDRQAVAKQVHAACQQLGFFYISNHGLSRAECEQALLLGRRIFTELPLDKKQALHVKHSPLFRGWRPSEAQQLQADGCTNDDPTHVPEHKESFNWGYQQELDPDGGDGRYVELDGTNTGGNVWPDEKDLPLFFEGIKEIYGKLLTLSRHLMSIIALALDLPENHFDDVMTHPGGIARLLYYPSMEGVANVKPVGIRPHSDFECLTLLLQSPCPGLQVLDPTGTWIDVAPVPDTLVVNVGDFLMRLTHDRYRSAVHRVVNKTTAERYSLVFFFSPNYDAVIETLPGCLPEDGVSHYAPVTAGNYIIERLRIANELGE